MVDLNAAIRGKSYQEFVDSIMQWQDEVFRMVSQSRPELADEVRFYGHVPLELLDVRQRLIMTGKYRDLIGFDNLLESLGTKPSGATNSQGLTGIFDKIGRKIGSRKQTDIENILSNMTQYVSQDSGFGRLLISGDYSNTPLLENIYRNMNIQIKDYFSPVFSGFEGELSDATASRFLGFGAKSIPVLGSRQVGTNKFAQSTAAAFDPSMLQGRKYTIFDLETAGLEAGQIRELSYATETGTQETIRFRPRQFRRGKIGYQDPVTGEFFTRTLEDEVASRLPRAEAAKYLSSSSDNLGDNFLDGINPFLEQIKNSDYVVGQNISKFDIENLFVSISRTSRYKNNTQYKDYIDNIYNDMVNNNKIVDTLELVRSNGSLQKLEVAKEFIDRGELKPFSIENLLLETDLIDYLKDPNNPAMSGADVFRDLITKGGLHTAEVDVAVTKALLYHHGDLKAISLQDSALRREILSSSALLPITNISGLSEISDVVLRKALEAGQLPENQIIQNASQSSLDVIEQFRQGKIPLSQLRQQLAQDTGIRYKMNMIEQGIIEQRDLSSGIIPGSSVPLEKEATIRGFGDFDRLTKKGTTELRRSLKKKSYLDMYRYGEDVSEADFAGYQKTMAGKNMPFAGLSYEERKIGSAIADATSSLGAIKNKPFMADLMISHFDQFNPQNPINYVTAGTERVTLPSQFLRNQGMLQQGESLGFSIVRPTLSSQETRVNLVKRLDDQQSKQLSREIFDLVNDDKRIEDLYKHINNLDMSMDSADLYQFIKKTEGLEDSKITEHVDQSVEKFRSSVRSSFNREAEIIKNEITRNGGTFTEKEINEKVIEKIAKNMQEGGVAIAQVGGRQAEDIVQILAQASGQRVEDVSDRNMLNISTAFVDSESSTVRTAGAFATRGLTDQDNKSIVEHIRLALSHEQNINQMSVLERSRATSLRSAVSSEAFDRVSRIHETVMKNMPHIKKASIAAVGIGAALTIYNRKRRQDVYDESMQQMPMERGTGYSVYDQLEVKKQLGINKYYQSYDPLATAYTVEQLNDARIGHTNMSPQRNNNLYGGVL